MSICRGRVRRTCATLVLVLFSASTCLASFAEAMKSGEALYRKGDFQQASAELESARAQDPADAQAALLLGLTYLRLDMPRKAAEEWQDYVKSARDPKLADDVARFRTILLREANQRDARAALADESKLSAAPADPQAVAVNTFRNLGAQEYAPLGKALAAMLIANLSAVPNLKVLERERVETLAQEVRLGGSGLVDKRTAAREGKLLRAQNVVAGSYADKQGAPPPIQTESSLFDARRNAEIGSSSAEAPVNEFYRIVPRTSAALLAGLGNPVTAMPADQATQAQNEHTRSLPAVLAFGRGLDLKDQGDYPGARAQFELALHEDPGFDLPRKELAVLPAALISLQAIANSVESAALAAPVAGASGLGVSGRTLAIVGGAAVVAGGIAAGVALSGGGGGGGGNNGAPTIQGAADQTVVVGQGQIRFEVTGTDPQGRNVTLSAQDLPRGATFPTTSGSPASQTFLWTPDADQVGTFPIVFIASSAGGTAQKTVTITVNPTGPTGGPTATPCAAANAACSSNIQCCNGNACDRVQPAGGTVCCRGLGLSCGGSTGDCCLTAAGATTSCQSGRCCISDGQVCDPTRSGDCCGGSCDPQTSRCVAVVTPTPMPSPTPAPPCATLGASCSDPSQCCTAQCDRVSQISENIPGRKCCTRVGQHCDHDSDCCSINSFCDQTHTCNGPNGATPTPQPTPPPTPRLTPPPTPQATPPPTPQPTPPCGTPGIGCSVGSDCCSGLCIYSVCQ